MVRQPDYDHNILVQTYAHDSFQYTIYCPVWILEMSCHLFNFLFRLFTLIKFYFYSYSIIWPGLSIKKTALSFSNETLNWILPIEMLLREVKTNDDTAFFETSKVSGHKWVRYFERMFGKLIHTRQFNFFRTIRRYQYKKFKSFFLFQPFKYNSSTVRTDNSGFLPRWC